MSEQTALQELANFVARSSLASENMATRNRALAGMTKRLLPRKRSVGGQNPSHGTRAGKRRA
jgi:hypothetical protein